MNYRITGQWADLRNWSKLKKIGTKHKIFRLIKFTFKLCTKSFLPKPLIKIVLNRPHKRIRKIKVWYKLRLKNQTKKQRGYKKLNRYKRVLSFPDSLSSTRPILDLRGLITRSIWFYVALGALKAQKKWFHIPETVQNINTMLVLETIRIWSSQLWKRDGGGPKLVTCLKLNLFGHSWSNQKLFSFAKNLLLSQILHFGLYLNRKLNQIQPLYGSSNKK